MVIILLFIFGLAVGSFLNVLIDRLSQDESIVYPPSHCDYCKKPLLWIDLVPVVSFIFLRARCRYCHKPISWRYPLVEILTGTAFVLAVNLKSGLPLLSILASIDTIYYLVVISVFIVIFFADLRYGIIPDKIVYPAIFASFLPLILNTQYLILNHLLSASGAFLFFLAIYAFTKGRGMGFGDVKLVFLLGLLFGFPKIVYVLYIAFLTGAVFSIILILLRRKKLKETVAFGPFLILGALLVFFFWNKLRLLWTLPVALP